MQPSRKQLRPYQVRLVTDVARASGDVLVEQPTGSGKTLAVVTLVAMHLGRRFMHAVIAAPQEQIEHGFVHRDYQTVAFPDCPGVAVPAVAVPEDFIWGARQSELGSVKRLLAYLRQSAPDHALACTHAALNRLTDAALPADLSGKALFIDEAHHASADGLSQIVSTWRERGGQLFFFTATPYRGDGRPVALEGMRLLRRSLAEHMADGFAPRHLDSEIVALGRPGDAITPAQFTGEDAPPPSYFDGLVTAICRKWVDDGKPKTIVRVPPMRGGSEGLVNRLLDALAAAGARTLDATGTLAEDKRRFLDALAAEKDRTHAASRFDVMVGIQRVLEGTDWPVCSAVYCVGMPGSLNTVVQLLGRAMRPKGADYPADQRDRARLVFFVPCGGGAALADLSLDHSRHALLTCCFLADHEVGQEWIVLREVRRGIEAALGPRDDNPAAADAENQADEALDPEVRAEIELAMASAREQIVSNGGEPTVGEVVRLAAQTRPDLPEDGFQRVAAEIIASQPGPGGEAGREAIYREVARRLRIDPMVKKAMEEAFAVVLEEFRAATLEGSDVLESIGRQVHQVTGGLMREFAQRLREAAPRPLTEEQVLAWADAYYARTGDWPTVLSGAIDNVEGETWNNCDQALRKGLRGFRGGSSLARLLSDARGVRHNYGVPDLSEELLAKWIKAHHERTGEWPIHLSGPVTDAPGETWRNIDQVLRSGRRGFAGGSSLARFREDHFGVRNPGNLPQLTTETIIEWIGHYHERTGKWPRQTSGVIPNSAGETWSSVDKALRGGKRGIVAISSMARLLEEHFGVQNHLNAPRIREEDIAAWAKTYQQNTGTWPMKSSGPIQGVVGLTWSIVDNALIRGTRGLTGGSSLAKFLDEHFGVPNRKNLSSLTEETIAQWAKHHFDQTGKWPTARSGIVQGTAGEKWVNIDAALRIGLRDLPGGSSLPKLLEKHLGVRNQKRPPKLTEAWIRDRVKIHHERTGSWPTENSGQLLDAPEETWKAIQVALYQGRRGLPGSSSVPRFLKEHFRVPIRGRERSTERENQGEEAGG